MGGAIHEGGLKGVNVEDFPELNVDALSRRIEIFTNRFPEIEKVWLYRSPDSPLKYMGYKIPHKYCIVFDLKNVTSEKITQIEEELGHSQTFDCEWKSDQSSLEPNLPDRFFNGLADQVYRNGPPNEFINHWSFIVRREADDETGEVEERDEAKEEEKGLPRWFTYDLTRCILHGEEENAKDKTPSNDEIVFFENVGTEIENIFKHIKKTIGFSAYKENLDGQLKEAALNKFDNEKESFKYIKREHLEDRSLYETADTNQKRDFIGKLLQKLRGDGSGYQPLYTKYLAYTKRLKSTRLD